MNLSNMILQGARYFPDKDAIVKDFPRTPQGKLLKRELREYSL